MDSIHAGKLKEGDKVVLSYIDNWGNPFTEVRTVAMVCSRFPKPGYVIEIKEEPCKGYCMTLFSEISST